jgi:hypothetical protein
MTNPTTAITKFSAARCAATNPNDAIKKARARDAAAIIRAADAVLAKAGVRVVAKPVARKVDDMHKLDGYPAGGLGDVLRARMAKGW